MSDIGSGDGELEGLSDALGRPIEQKIHSFNKQAAGAGWKWFKRTLGTLTEPFFQKEMGERYYSSDAFGSGCAVWGIGTLIALGLWHYGSIYGIPRWAMASHLISCVALIVANWKLGLESLSKMARYRNEGIAHHTMSRGVPRFGDANTAAKAGIAVLVLILNPLCGVIFIAGLVMNGKLRAEQEAAIMSRYLDALDQQVEKEYLEDALLDRCPTEITFLNAPISKKYNDNTRSNIAAAVVGKPVKITAKRPRSLKSQPEPEAKAQNVAEQDFPRSNVKSAAKPPTAASNPEPTPAPQSSASASQPRQESKGRGGMLLIIGTLLLLTAVGAILHFKAKPKTEPASVVSSTQPYTAPPVTAPVLIPAATPFPAKDALRPEPMAMTSNDASKHPVASAAQKIMTEHAEDPDARSPVEPVITNSKTPEVIPARAPAAPVVLAQVEPPMVVETPQQIMDKVQHTFDTQTDQLERFQSECIRRLSNNAASIRKFSGSSRARLKKMYDANFDLTKSVMRDQSGKILEITRPIQGPGSIQITRDRLIRISDQLNTLIPKMELERREVFEEFDKLDATLLAMKN